MMRITRFFLILTIFCLTFLPRLVSAQNVSEKARRHMDRGQAAIEMATTPADLNDAAKEFQKAIDLAPAWPDPYYNIGMTQNKMERFDDALKNLRIYLQLAPNAGNAQEVQQIVSKIEYKKDKENQVKKAFELFGSGKSVCKIISQTNSDGEGVIGRFSTQDGGLVIGNSYLYASVRQDVPSYRVWSGYVKRRPEWSPWVPVHINGRSYEYTYIYVVPTVHKRKGAYLVVEVKGTGEIISLDPLRAKTMVTTRQVMIISEKGEAEAWGFADTSEIVEECRPKIHGFELASIIRNNDKETVESLIAQGLDINAKDKFGGTPLEMAISQKKIEIVELLIANGADVTTSMLDASRSNTEIASLLITKGANVNVKEQYGYTPLHLTVMDNNIKMAALLIANRADINAKDNNGYTSLENAVRDNKLEMAALLIDKGADIHAKDKYGNTYLHRAVTDRKKEIIELLIAKGADINAKDKYGNTPLQYAEAKHLEEIVGLLKKHGARR